MCNVIWAIDKGLVFEDEAFYLLHFRPDVHTVNPGSWQLIFRPLFVENLVHLRLLTVALMTAAAFFLGFACSKALRLPTKPWVTGLLSASANFLLWTPIQLVPTYLTLNAITIYFSVAFFVLSIPKNGMPRVAALVASGLFAGLVPFVMITNSGLLVALLFAISFTRNNSERSVGTASFLTGCGLSAVIYFALIQDPMAFLLKIKEASLYVSFDGFYGPFQLIQWHIRIVKDFIGRPLALALCVVLITSGALKSRLLNVLLVGLAVVLGAAQLHRDLTLAYAIFPITLWYVGLCLLAVSAAEENRGDQGSWVVVLLLATVPYFASTGTFSAFEVRGACYFASLVLAIFGAISLCGNRRGHVLPALGLLVVCLLNFFSFNFREGWGRYKRSDQDQSVVIEPEGGHIYLDARRRDLVEKVRPLLQQRQRVVVSDPSGWGYVYLVGASPLYLYFRFNEKALNHFLAEEKIPLSAVTCMELKGMPFPAEFTRKLLELEGFSRVDLGEVALYRRNSGESQPPQESTPTALDRTRLR